MPSLHAAVNDDEDNNDDIVATHYAFICTLHSVEFLITLWPDMLNRWLYELTRERILPAHFLFSLEEFARNTGMQMRKRTRANLFLLGYWAILLESGKSANLRYILESYAFSVTIVRIDCLISNFISIEALV